jgi:hypothetical protein
MKSAYRWISAAALCVASFGLKPQAFAAELTLARDGWTSWEVAAVDDAPDLCCFGNGNNYRDLPRTACRLDGKQQSWGTRDDATTERVRIYARTAGGRIDRFRVLSAACPAEAATQIRDLGSVDENDSARWLAGLVKQEDDVVIALALNRGNVARDALAGIARNDSRTETRKEAVFWLAQVRGQEGADITSSVMFHDKDPEVREHAAFSLSQSKSPRAEADLVRLVTSDKDEDVREGAVFALSQLPDERAARALIAAAENRALERELRKKAVFWLSQSESDEAQKYLERVLTSN